MIWSLNEHVGFMFSFTCWGLDLNALRFYRSWVLDSFHFSNSSRYWTFIWLRKQLQSCYHLVSKMRISNNYKSDNYWQYSWSTYWNCISCIFHYWSCKSTFTMARSNETADFEWNQQICFDFEHNIFSYLSSLLCSSNRKAKASSKWRNVWKEVILIRAGKSFLLGKCESSI